MTAQIFKDFAAQLSVKEIKQKCLENDDYAAGLTQPCDPDYSPYKGKRPVSLLDVLLLGTDRILYEAGMMEGDAEGLVIPFPSISFAYIKAFIQALPPEKIHVDKYLGNKVGKHLFQPQNIFLLRLLVEANKGNEWSFLSNPPIIDFENADCEGDGGDPKDGGWHYPDLYALASAIKKPGNEALWEQAFNEAASKLYDTLLQKISPSSVFEISKFMLNKLPDLNNWMHLFGLSSNYLPQDIKTLVDEGNLEKILSSPYPTTWFYLIRYYNSQATEDSILDSAVFQCNPDPFGLRRKRSFRLEGLALYQAFETAQSRLLSPNGSCGNSKNCGIESIDKALEICNGINMGYNDMERYIYYLAANQNGLETINAGLQQLDRAKSPEEYRELQKYALQYQANIAKMTKDNQHSALVDLLFQEIRGEEISSTPRVTGVIMPTMEHLITMADNTFGLSQENKAHLKDKQELGQKNEELEQRVRELEAKLARLSAPAVSVGTSPAAFYSISPGKEKDKGDSLEGFFGPQGKTG